MLSSSGHIIIPDQSSPCHKVQRQCFHDYNDVEIHLLMDGVQNQWLRGVKDRTGVTK